MEAASKLDSDGLLERARALVAELEAGDVEAADRLILELGRQRESGLFQELGKMTRQLHDALNGFELDARMQALAENDIPDARLRLNHVIEMTESSANRTLTAVEQTLPIAEQLQQVSNGLHEKWARFRKRDMGVDEFRRMSREIDDFLGVTCRHAEQIHGNLSEVMMAQDFQDLTGQIIRRVITLVQEVEERLVELIRLSGGVESGTASEDGGAVKRDEEQLMRGIGPKVPGVATEGGSVSGQDEVDDLLSSLGF
ncbi:MAG TPA: protein phosphatase CheZ [Gammaproteobacteria bacterium]|nr:protein phosphatase CheZ [Gammaproteobacteria bacterium]